MSALIDPDLLFPAERAVARHCARSLCRRSRTCRSSARTATPIRAGMPRTSRFPIRRSCSIVPDHYVFRMLFSQGVRLEDLGVPTRRRRAGRDRRPRRSGGASPRTTTCSAARRPGCGSTTRCATLFGIDEPLTAGNCRRASTTTSPSCCRREAFRPRALFERFNIEVIATTESALDDLRWHQMIRDSGWKGRVVTAYRPDAVVDPDFEGFRGNLDTLGEITGCDTGTLGRLSRRAPRAPRLLQELRRDLDRPRPPDGARPPTCPHAEAAGAVRQGPRRQGRRRASATLFRGQMLTEMAQDEPRRRAGAADPSRLLAQPLARDVRAASAATRASISRPAPTTSRALKPLLDAVGTRADLTVIALHARRDQLCARTGAAGRRLSGAEARAALVVPRQPRGHAPLPRDDDRDGRLLQHRRLQRRHPRLPLDPGAARRGAPGRLRLPRRASSPSTGCGEDEAHEVAQDLAYTLAKKAYRL